MFSVPEVAVILVVVLVIFGPGKLPDLGSALGKGLKGFRKAVEADEHPSEDAPKVPSAQSAKRELVAAKESPPEQSNAK